VKFGELKELTDEELARKLEDLRESYMKLRFQHATGQLDSHVKLRQARRDIARINTLFSQRAPKAPAESGKE